MVNNDDHCAGIILDIMAWLGLFYNVLDISLVIPISTAQFIVVMLRSCTRSPVRAFTLIGLDLWAMGIGSGENVQRHVVEKCHRQKILGYALLFPSLYHIDSQDCD